MSDELTKELRSLIAQYGYDAIAAKIRDEERESYRKNVCTIIVNEGLHKFPDYIMQGHLYVFSRGNMDMSSKESIEEELTENIENLALFLKTRKWSKIYIVISGHAALCMQVKLAVYRVTHIDTVDWVYDGQGRYLDAFIPMREIVGRRRLA